MTVWHVYSDVSYTTDSVELYIRPKTHQAAPLAPAAARYPPQQPHTPHHKSAQNRARRPIPALPTGARAAARSLGVARAPLRRPAPPAGALRAVHAASAGWPKSPAARCTWRRRNRCDRGRGRRQRGGPAPAASYPSATCAVGRAIERRNCCLRGAATPTSFNGAAVREHHTFAIRPPSWPPSRWPAGARWPAARRASRPASW